MDKNVYQCIAAVSAEMADVGISKDRTNTQQNYKFRGIDDVYNTLAPMLARNGLVILPRCLSREVTERTSAKGGALFSVTVEMEFDFVSAHDMTKHTVKTYGEAMDSADKATNKAMSAAYKYACFQAFCIPTEGDNDADATTHEVVARTACGRCGAVATIRSGSEWLCDSCDGKPDLAETIEAMVHEGNGGALQDIIAMIAVTPARGEYKSRVVRAALVGLAQLTNDDASLAAARAAANKHKGLLNPTDAKEVREAIEKAKSMLASVSA